MKKQSASLVLCALLAPVLLNTHLYTVHATDATNQQKVTQSETSNQEVDRKGLMGYYFKELNFKELTLFAPTRESSLGYDQATVNELLNTSKQNYRSVKWVGQVQSKTSGDFSFELSDDQNAVIKLDGKVVSYRGQEKKVVHLEKNKFISIEIEYQSPKDMDSNSLKEIKLYKIDNQKKVHQITQEELFNPEFDTNKNKLTGRSAVDDDTDTDGDSIPDNWEVTGYTIKNKVAVKWEDAFASEGYTKFVSNPLESHTVGDPYTDYEKAARDMDLANGEETFNPMVAAFPNVNVSMEKMILSTDQNLTNTAESNSSNDWTYTNTEGISATAGVSGLLGPSISVTANYQHSETVGAHWGSSNSNTTQFNSASAGYLNANVRYNNVGTGAIYDTKPTTNFVLEGATIATITAQSNATALSIAPGASYPQKGQNGIALNTMDEFSSKPITLNKPQLDQLLDNKPLSLETTQVDGGYRVKDVSGNIVDGGKWSGVINQIKAKTASIIINSGDSTTERRVAAKDYQNPEDKTPSLTLKEALKMAYKGITEKDGLMYYKDKPLSESSVYACVDEATKTEIDQQLNDDTGQFKDVKTLYDVKLTPGMNITIVQPDLFLDANASHGNDDNGIWYYTYNKQMEGYTGSRSFSCAKRGYIDLSDAAKNKLKVGSNYVLTMYIKAEAANETLIKVSDESAHQFEYKTVEVGNGDYQKVSFVIPNTEGHKISSISINPTDGVNTYWDDISLIRAEA